MTARRVRLALDGPAGTGKSTVSKRAARELVTRTSIPARCTERSPAWPFSEGLG